MRRIGSALGALALGLLAVAGSAEPIRMVVCVPGYPSNTEQAQPILDEFAGWVERAAEWESGRLAAVYHPSVEGGLGSLDEVESALAVVPLPFYLQYRDALALRPLLRVDQAAGPHEVWSLVAKRGAVSTPASLEGWEVAGMPGYAPDFVRDIALSDWGDLPETLQIRFSARVLSVLRSAAKGERVAAILDSSQTQALESLPFASELEVVTSSRPVVGILLCAVGDRLSDADEETLLRAFLRLHERQGGGELLSTLRVQRFRDLSPEELIPFEQAYRSTTD